MTISLADVLAEWAVSLTGDAVPAAVIGKAKRSLVDAIGVAVAGAEHPTTRMIREAAVEEYAAGPCRVLGSGGIKLSAPGAALVNGVAAHVHDFDDTCYDGIVHGSAAVWPAAAAAAEAAGASGRDFLFAFIAGVEVEYALGRLLTDHLYWKGWWNSGLLGALGAAAAAARALSLEPAAARNALRIAACQATGPRVLLGTPVKPYALGCAAAAGVRAALMSRRGLTGPEKAFEHDQGFIKLFNDGLCRPEVLEDLGRRFSLESPGVAFKLYPVCSAAQAAVEATASILAEEKMPAGQVEKVLCRVTPLVAVCLEYDHPGTVTEAQFSLPFAVGCLLAYGQLGVAELSEAVLRDPDLLAHMAKVEMEASETLVASESARKDYPEAALVTIFTRDGRKFEKFNGAATGMPVNPMSDRRLEEKFLACAGLNLDQARARGLLDRIREVETLESASGLFPAWKEQNQAPALEHAGRRGGERP
ncbi:MAG: MmgE/PrpD family protein [Thermodesulfobacteriota bacterium]